jgi:hypothetical protein
MQRRIRRSALIVSCVAALTAISVGSAQAALTAVTGQANSVTANSAVLTGTVSSGGAVTQWVFSYTLAGNPFQGSDTAGGQIGAATTTRAQISDLALNLTPSTTYSFQLIADNATLGTTSALLVPVYGGVLTFTTTGPGSASLASTKLKVKHGRASVAIKCSDALTCSGGTLAITARDKGKSVACGSVTFSVDAGATQTISTSRLSGKCTTLLVASTKHKISAELTAAFTYQKGISKRVTLTTAK